MPQPKPQQPAQQPAPVPAVQQQAKAHPNPRRQGRKKKKDGDVVNEIPGMPASNPAPDPAKQPAEAAQGSNKDTPILEHLQHAQGQRVVQQKLHNERVQVDAKTRESAKQLEDMQVR